MTPARLPRRACRCRRLHYIRDCSLGRAAPTVICTAPVAVVAVEDAYPVGAARRSPRRAEAKLLLIA